GSSRSPISVRRSSPPRAGGRQVAAPLQSVAPLRGRHATPRSSRWVIGWGGFHGGTAVWPGTFSHGGTDFRLGGWPPVRWARRANARWARSLGQPTVSEWPWPRCVGARSTMTAGPLSWTIASTFDEGA